MKFPKTLAFLVALMVSLTSFQCEDFFYEYITLINKSDETIYGVFYTTPYPVDELPFDVEACFDTLGTRPFRIPTGMTYAKECSFNENSKFRKRKRTYIMIVGQNTLDSLSKEEIIEKNIYDTLLVFTYKELHEKNFQISYEGRKK